MSEVRVYCWMLKIYLESLRVAFSFFWFLTQMIVDCWSSWLFHHMLIWTRSFTRWHWESFEEFLKDFVGTLWWCICLLVEYLVANIALICTLLKESAPNLLGSQIHLRSWLLSGCLNGCPLISLSAEVFYDAFITLLWKGEKQKAPVLISKKSPRVAFFGLKTEHPRGNRGVLSGCFWGWNLRRRTRGCLGGSR